MHPADAPPTADADLRADLAQPLTVIRCRTDLARRRVAALPLAAADRDHLDRQFAAVDAAVSDVVRRLDTDPRRRQDG